MCLANSNNSLTSRHPNGDPARVAEMLVAVPGAPAVPTASAAARAGVVNTTAAMTIKAAAGAGLRSHISGLQVSHATLGEATELAIRDGAGAPFCARQARTLAGASATWPFPSPLAGSANTLLQVVTPTAVTGGVHVNAQGDVAL
jgi:hypothetical protein